LNAPNCAKCGKPLSGETAEWVNNVYHIDCFCCTTCGKKLVSECLNIAGSPYCESCGKKAFVQNMKQKKEGNQTSQSPRQNQTNQSPKQPFNKTSRKSVLSRFPLLEQNERVEREKRQGNKNIDVLKEIENSEIKKENINLTETFVLRLDMGNDNESNILKKIGAKRREKLNDELTKSGDSSNQEEDQKLKEEQRLNEEKKLEEEKRLQDEKIKEEENRLQDEKNKRRGE